MTNVARKNNNQFIILLCSCFNNFILPKKAPFNYLNSFPVIDVLNLNSMINNTLYTLNHFKKRCLLIS